MKHYIFLAAVFLLIQFATAQTKTCTTFPTSSEGTDYAVKGFTVEAAFPLSDSLGRMLVKGSHTFKWFKAINTAGETVQAPQQLMPPNYTAIATLPTGNVQVLFSADGNLYDPKNSIAAACIDKRQFQQPDSVMSILLYGCFEPFEINKKNGEASLNKGKHNSNYFMRNLFNKVALQKPIYYTETLRNNDSGRYEFIDHQEKIKAPVLKNIKAILGTGDQVYVDAGYKNQKDKTAISTWQIKEKPMPLVDSACYESHLNNMYMHFSSFNYLQEVFAQIPSFTMWDDHEIRDGWGSHGDEYVDGVLTQPLKTFYNLSRRAFIEHQWAKGPTTPMQIENGVKENQSLHTAFAIGSKSCFMFDLRSERDINRYQAAGKQQMTDFKNWLQQLQQGEEIVIISSIPIFIRYYGVTNLSGILDAELKDDMYDGWDSKYNIAQRDSIVSWLLAARINKNIKPYIVSGDIHTSGISEIWYDDESNNNLCFGESKKDRKVLAYEIIASGLNHETLNQGGLKEVINSKTKRAMKDLRVNDAMIQNITVNNQQYSVDNFFRAYQSKLNFGAIQFLPGHTLLHVFMFNYSRADHVEELIVEAEWDKTEVADRKHYKIKNNTCNNFNYAPPLPQQRRKIYVRKNW
jgi:PhoD-like phosphatase